MPIYARSQQELVTDCLSELSQNTALTRLGPGGKARAIVDTVAKRVNEAYTILDVGLARSFISSAPGQWLDLFGDLLALPRLSSVAASASDALEVQKFYVATGSFGDINGGVNITIPHGTTISSEVDSQGILYRLTSDLVCPAAGNSVWASVEALTTGEDANVGNNSLRYHSFTGYVDYLAKSLLTTNVHPIANGKNFEGDTNYRYRLSRRVLEAEAANETAIRLAALSTPGVADVVMIRYYRGIGTYGVIIKSVTSTVRDSLVNDVTSNVFKVEGYGSRSYIRGPKETGISMTLSVHYSKQLTEDELLAIEAAIQDSIINYVNNLDVGEPLYLNRITAPLFSISTSITAIGTSVQPFDELYVWRTTRTADNRIREKLLGDYTPAIDERVIIEPSLTQPVILNRIFG